MTQRPTGKLAKLIFAHLLQLNGFRPSGDRLFGRAQLVAGLNDAGGINQAIEHGGHRPQHDGRQNSGAADRKKEHIVSSGPAGCTLHEEHLAPKHHGRHTSP